MHRGGKTEKKGAAAQEKQAGDEEDEAGVSEMVGSTEGEGREPTLSDLMSILQTHMGQQLEVQARTSPVPEQSSATPEPPEPVELSPTSRYPQAQAEPTRPLSGKGSAHLRSIMMRAIRSCMLVLKICMGSGSSQKVWIREHNPPSAVKAAELAEVFMAARRKGQPWSYNTYTLAMEGPKSAQMYHQGPASADKTPVGGNQLADERTTEENERACPVKHDGNPAEAEVLV
ncbi:hypothetical protein CHARACLAT_017082 [Characodon lateralis]|uniref:Uncharacterized protein n=1 Tax=Characodon lateralis TaxID=208331 RepID=A0ABU7E173_9TELE|nr:hypothetical protein [Characodon lateralis]